MKLVKPSTLRHWQELLAEVNDQVAKDRRKIDLETFRIKEDEYNMASLIHTLDRATSFSLWASDTAENWMYRESQIKQWAAEEAQRFEEGMDDARSDESKVNKLLTTGRSWEERASSYRMSNLSLYRINEAAKTTVEAVRMATMMLREPSRALRNLRDDIDLRVRMMQLQARLNNSPIYDD